MLGRDIPINIYFVSLIPKIAEQYARLFLLKSYFLDAISA
jgi:hypothetical protein